MSALIFESKNMNAVGKSAIVNCEWEARHEVAPYIFINDSPTLRHDHRDCPVCVVKKLDAQLCNAAFIVLPGLNQFRLGIGVVDQSHLSERRAASMTSSCVRPSTWPDESSLSRRTASATAARSSASGRPASMLSQSAWASDTRSESGSAIASAMSCSVLIAKHYRLESGSSRIPTRGAANCSQSADPAQILRLAAPAIERSSVSGSIGLATWTWNPAASERARSSSVT